MTPVILIPLFYQLLQAYRPNPTNYFSPKTTVVNTKTTANISPTPSPVANIVTTNPEPLAIGGDQAAPNKVIRIALLGDSMIDTIKDDISYFKKSLSTYYPDTFFMITPYAYPASTIEKGLDKLKEEVVPTKPDIIVVESFAYNNYGNNQQGTDKHWLNLGAITSTIDEKLPNTRIVISATIAPNSIIFANGKENYSALEKIEKTSTIKNYLQNAVNFATSQRFPLANTYNISTDIKNEGLKELIDPVDNIHPSEAGAKLYFDTITKTIFDNNLI